MASGFISGPLHARVDPSKSDEYIPSITVHGNVGGWTLDVKFEIPKENYRGPGQYSINPDWDGNLVDISGQPTSPDEIGYIAAYADRGSLTFAPVGQTSSFTFHVTASGHQLVMTRQLHTPMTSEEHP